MKIVMIRHEGSNAPTRARLRWLNAHLAGSALGCAVLCCTACTDVESRQNIGDLCLLPAGFDVGEDDGNDVLYPANKPVKIRVALEDCVSGCAENFEASCEATLADGEIKVEAHGSYEVPNRGNSCPGVCLVLGATCDTPELAAGTYVVRYAGHEETLVVAQETKLVASNDDACGQSFGKWDAPQPHARNLQQP